jgi:hypothetical protein
LTTSPIPYGTRTFELEFDFSKHVLQVSTDDGSYRVIALSPRSVAEFYADVRRALSELGIDVHIYEITASRGFANRRFSPVPWREVGRSPVARVGAPIGMEAA